jgi:hypothetical protein
MPEGDGREGAGMRVKEKIRREFDFWLGDQMDEVVKSRVSHEMRRKLNLFPFSNGGPTNGSLVVLRRWYRQYAEGGGG